MSILITKFNWWNMFYLKNNFQTLSSLKSTTINVYLDIIVLLLMLNRHMTYASKCWMSRLKWNAAFLDDLIVEVSTKEEILKRLFSDFRTESNIFFHVKAERCLFFSIRRLSTSGLFLQESSTAPTGKQNPADKYFDGSFFSAIIELSWITFWKKNDFLWNWSTDWLSDFNKIKTTFFRLASYTQEFIFEHHCGVSYLEPWLNVSFPKVDRRPLLTHKYHWYLLKENMV